MMLSIRYSSRASFAGFAPRPGSLQCQRMSVVRRVGEGGVQDLLARDRKKANLAPELMDEKDVNVEGVLEKYERSGKPPQVVKSRRQRQENLANDASSDIKGPDSPKKCKEAIDKGLELFQAKQYQQAIDMFNLALELPGNGAYRSAVSPREYSCPSDAEENACLYNMACAYAQMGQKQSAVTCLEAVLENGFDDYKTIRTDPDLAPIRGRELEDLLGRYDGLSAKLLGFLPLPGKANKPKTLETDTKGKPWIMW